MGQGPIIIFGWCWIQHDSHDDHGAIEDVLGFQGSHPCIKGAHGGSKVVWSIQESQWVLGIVWGIQGSHTTLGGVYGIKENQLGSDCLGDTRKS